MNAREPGSLEAAIARAYEQCGGIKQVAHLLDRSPTQLYAYADPSDPQSMPMAFAARLASLGGVALAEHFAALCGGSFRPEGAAAESAGVIALAAEAVREGGEAVATAIAAAADGELSAAERRAVAAEAEQAIGAFTRLRGAMGLAPARVPSLAKGRRR